MSRLGRVTRRADEWSSPHERARTRAAQQLDWELDPGESAWLEAHLAGCLRCRTLTAEYVEIRERLRGLRAVSPDPPRDLWARTATAIEREAARAQGRRRWAIGRAPLGALSGVLVVAVVIGATLLSNLSVRTQVTPPSPGPITAVTSAPGGTPAPVGTPIVVGAGDVPFLRLAENGEYGYAVARVDKVCPDDGKAECPTVEAAAQTALAFESDPKSIISSPDDNQAIVVAGKEGSTASSVYVMPLPTDAEATAAPSDAVATPPPASDPPVGTADASEPAPSPETTEPVESPGVTQEPTDEPDPTDQPDPTTTDEPSLGTGAVAIAHDLIVAGESAAYSGDGAWFAFTARPADGAHGPDIYVWRVGDDEAVPVTTDHSSNFASWIDGQLVGSRPTATSANHDESTVESFLLDPSTGEETALVDAGWRPSVAPSGELALTWNGTVVRLDDGRLVGPGEGRLELQRWDGARGPVDPADATLVTRSGSAAFDARWDESSSAFAVWIEDPADSRIGRLSLYFVDRETGRIDQPEYAPRDVPALSGFSIESGRLAWATPPGQGGEGSRVLIVAWTEDGVGRIESAPGDQLLVIR